MKPAKPLFLNSEIPGISDFWGLVLLRGHGDLLPDLRRLAKIESLIAVDTGSGV